jgi:hypothetical protein
MAESATLDGRTHRWHGWELAFARSPQLPRRQARNRVSAAKITFPISFEGLEDRTLFNMTTVDVASFKDVMNLIDPSAIT